MDNYTALILALLLGIVGTGGLLGYGLLLILDIKHKKSIIDQTNTTEEEINK